jgi:hypothetical protein
LRPPTRCSRPPPHSPSTNRQLPSSTSRRPDACDAPPSAATRCRCHLSQARFSWRPCTHATGSQSAPDLVVAAVGNLLLGFAVACAARRRSDEPGMWAATAITVLLVIPPGLGPVPRLIQTFPNPSHSASLSSNTWWSLAIVGSLTSIPASTLRWRPFSRLKRWPTPFRLAATRGPHPESLHTTTGEMTRTRDTEVHLRRSDDAVKYNPRPLTHWSRAEPSPRPSRRPR